MKTGGRFKLKNEGSFGRTSLRKRFVKSYAFVTMRTCIRINSWSSGHVASSRLHASKARRNFRSGAATTGVFASFSQRRFLETFEDPLRPEEDKVSRALAVYCVERDTPLLLQNAAAFGAVRLENVRVHTCVCVRALDEKEET